MNNTEHIPAAPGLSPRHSQILQVINREGGCSVDDLALSLGHQPAGVPVIPEVVGAIEEIVRRSRDCGVVAGIHCGSVEMAKDWIAKGFQFVTVYTDFVAMVTKSRENLTALSE